MIRSSALSIVLGMGFLLACSYPVGKDEVLQSYRIVFQGKEYSFEMQMLYLVSVLEIYRLHVGAYPSLRNNLDALMAKPAILEGTGQWFGPYAESDTLFYDPWHNKISYSFNDLGELDLRSLGPDGVHSRDDITAQDLLPDWFREMKKLSTLGPILIQPAPTP